MRLTLEHCRCRELVAEQNERALELQSRKVQFGASEALGAEHKASKQAYARARKRLSGNS